MSKVSFTSLMVLCAALAACSDNDTTRTLTAPHVEPTLSEATADLGLGVTADGPFDLAFGTDAPASQMAAAAQAATGGRSSGHVGFSFSPPAFGVITQEQYSYVALGTDASTPFAAKGQYELMLTTRTGIEQKIHGEVICMSVVGNTARMAGRITKVWINNVQRPITGATHTIWTVQDNGEGQGTTDTASLMFFNNAANALTHCAVGFTPPLFTNQEGNVQVQQ